MNFKGTILNMTDVIKICYSRRLMALYILLSFTVLICMAKDDNSEEDFLGYHLEFEKDNAIFDNCFNDILMVDSIINSKSNPERLTQSANKPLYVYIVSPPEFYTKYSDRYNILFLKKESPYNAYSKKYRKLFKDGITVFDTSLKLVNDKLIIIVCVVHSKYDKKEKRINSVTSLPIYKFTHKLNCENGSWSLQDIKCIYSSTDF